MKRKRTICRKITLLLLCMVFTALLFTGLVSLWSLYSMRSISEESSRRLGRTAAADAEQALEQMAGEQLLYIAVEKAAYIEEKFNAIVSCVNGIAQAAEEIYQNPENYPDREVPLPVRDSRELAPQLLWSQRLAGDRTEQLRELYKLGNLQDLLVQYNANNDMISSTYLATQSGWMLQADYIAYRKYSGDSELPDCYEAEERQWYQRALLAERGECVYTDVMEDIHEGRDCIVCARAVYADGQIVAVAGVGSYLDTVSEAVLRTGIGEKGYAFLVNENGMVIVSGAGSGETMADVCLPESENLALAEAAEDMVSGGSGLKKLMLDGREVCLAYAPLEGLGWSFVTVMDMEEVFAPARESERTILALTDTVSDQQNTAIRRTLYLFLVIMLLAAALISVTGILFARRLTDPIRRLTAEVTKLDGENLDKQIRIHSGDEVEELGNAFQKMIAQLRRYINNLAAVTSEKERIRTEIEVASRLQADMLPEAEDAFSDRKEFELHAVMIPAKGVGGDFYDFFLLDDDHLALVMADVSGKGVPAALFMVVSRTMIRSRLRAWKSSGSLAAWKNSDSLTAWKSSDSLAEAPLGRVVEEINDSLCENNKNGMFVTAWIGILTISTGVLDFVNAGHCYPLILHPNGVSEYEKTLGGFVLAGMEKRMYRQSRLRLRKGDIILLYTDGVTEAADPQKKLYGEERLKASAEKRNVSKPKELLQAIWQDVDCFRMGEEQSDDITILALRYQNGGTGRMRLEIAADIAHMDAVQRFVEETFSEEAVSRRDVRRMLLASDEIFSNICRHSGAKTVTVECGVTYHEAMLVFEDDGVAFDPLKSPKPDVTEPLEKRKAGGLGIYMVQELLDRVSYSRMDEKNRLTIFCFRDGKEKTWDTEEQKIDLSYEFCNYPNL